jgi:hypothetical protein
MDIVIGNYIVIFKAYLSCLVSASTKSRREPCNIAALFDWNSTFYSTEMSHEMSDENTFTIPNPVLACFSYFPRLQFKLCRFDYFGGLRFYLFG